MAELLTIKNAEERWSQIKAQQGFIGKAWNGIKEFTNLGKSESDCESMLEAYKNHEITLAEAMEYIEDFEKKQDNASNLITNIATGVASIALATSTCGLSIGWLQALKFGAPIGAAVKTAIKGLDRATNDIEDDALDAKEIVRDAVSGAVTGTTSAVSAGIFQGVKEAKATKTVAEGLKTSVLNGAKCGAQCGAIAGAIDYTTDTALDEDKKFNFGQLTRNTGAQAALSAAIGGTFGGGVFGVEALKGNLGKEMTTTIKDAIFRDCALSSSKKVAGNLEKQALCA